MPIPLGVLAVAGAGAAGAAGAYELISSEILTGTQASITFSNLNSTYGSIYQHLQIRAVNRSTRTTGGISTLYITFNGITSASYSGHVLFGNGSSVTSQGGGNAINIGGATTSTNTQTSNIFGSQIIDILDAFETTKNTTVRAIGGVAGSSNEITLASGAFINTAAIDSINIAVEGGSWVANSRFSLYGLRSA